MALTYSLWVTSVCANLQYSQIVVDATLAAPTSNADVNNALTESIQYAEQRIYRELDLIETVTSANVSLTPNVRSVAIPGSLIVPMSAYVITPAATSPDAAGAQRNPLQRMSVDFINNVCPVGTSPAGSSVPTYWASLDNVTAIFGPAPDAAYKVEFIGTTRPAPLSSTNTTTILTNYIPDVFLTASMIYMAGFQRDYGAQSSDPQMAQSWESQYQLQMASAQVEEFRKKSQSTDWQTYLPSPLASQPRA